jgi:hypothetical protein
MDKQEEEEEEATNWLGLHINNISVIINCHQKDIEASDYLVKSMISIPPQLLI